MAIARPIRFLILAAVCTLLYIIYAYSGSEEPVRKIPNPDDPGREFRVDKNFVDPNLESMFPEKPHYPVIGLMKSVEQLQMNPPNHYDE